MKTSRSNKGQFSIIAALLVSVILVSAVISTYTMVRHAPLQDSPKVLTAIGEMNSDIKRILDFTVGYYGSILRVTGNSTYAQTLTTQYLSSGLVNIARSHPEWNPSLKLDTNHVSTRWYMPESYSVGSISVSYSLTALGIKDVKYETSSALKVTMLESSSGVARVEVLRDNYEPELGLTRENFWFYNYTDDSNWELIHPENNPTISSTGIYNITIPLNVDPDAYSIQIGDRRGLLVSAFYSPRSVESGIPQYTYSFNWDADGMESIYNQLASDTMVIEALQNGTLRWLDQNLALTTTPKRIPPVAVKALHVNTTTLNGVNSEVSFQVEDWASGYKVPLGLTGNTSLFKNNNMVVFLVNHNVEKVTLWWDGSDTTTQTSFAWKNKYFESDYLDQSGNGFLSNNILNLDIDASGDAFAVTSDMGTSSSRAEFLLINGEDPDYGANPAYVIHNGIVRDIVQQEAEWDYDENGFPNLYAQIVLTLPANSTFYTYAVRTIFVDSSEIDIDDRIINDLSLLQLDVTPGGSGIGACVTENGVNANGFPVPSALEGVFNNTTEWAHHWIEFLKSDRGVGVMFTDNSNLKLYRFDSLASSKVGSLFIDMVSDDQAYIQVNPVHQPFAEFDSPLDITWYGAVVTFNGEPIYQSANDGGLWVMVEYPPTVTVD
jgi:hypothetical protein